MSTKAKQMKDNLSRIIRYLIPEKMFDNASDDNMRKIERLLKNARAVVIPFDGSEKDSISFVRKKCGEKLWKDVEKTTDYRLWRGEDL